MMSEDLIMLIDVSPDLTLEEKTLIKNVFPTVRKFLGKRIKTKDDELWLLAKFIGFLRVCAL